MLRQNQLPYYFQLMRLHKPIGILLLLWPTLWALWLAKRGFPDLKILMVFITGVVLMRSAGCVINDFADKKFDRYVTRTKDRPYASGKVQTTEVIGLAGFLVFLAFLLVLSCNSLTIMLAFVGMGLAVAYPFLKRITHLPQLGLSLAFTWGVPMAFAAQLNYIPKNAWFLFVTGTVWPLMYDTIYAIIDRKDDVKIGVKSTAILFDDMDKLIIGLLQTLFVAMLVIVGLMFRLKFPYYFSLVIVISLFIYQQWLIKTRDPEKCLAAFNNNNWVGLAIFAGIVFSRYYSECASMLLHMRDFL